METLLECRVCMAEIPSDQLHASESQDYVANFCGLACYEQLRSLPEPAPKDIKTPE